jgi:hypothetical protein
LRSSDRCRGWGAAFYAFSLILLPVLAFVGFVTFQRLVQSSMDDVAYAQRIARLRKLHVALAPELEPYLVVSRRRPPESRLIGGVFAPGEWQVTRTTAGRYATLAAEAQATRRATPGS